MQLDNSIYSAILLFDRLCLACSFIHSSIASCNAILIFPFLKPLVLATVLLNVLRCHLLRLYSFYPPSLLGDITIQTHILAACQKVFLEVFFKPICINITYQYIIMEHILFPFEHITLVCQYPNKWDIDLPQAT